MFENVGEKIKSIAKFVCWGGIAADIILAIIMFVAADEDYYNQETYVLIGLICLIVGPVLSWISSLLLYAFGEINVSLMIMSQQEQNYDLQKAAIKRVQNFNSQKFERKEGFDTLKKIEALKKWKKLGIISDDEFIEKSKTIETNDI